MDAEEAYRALSGLPTGPVLGLLGLAAFVEYVFPPFPGDTVVVGGAALVGAAGWPAGPVLAATTLGAVAGAAVDVELGRRLAASGRVPDHPDVDAIVDLFRRRGAAALVLNRFVPGVRGVFFVAAGIAGVPRGRALGWAAVSALLWNGLLVGLGTALGQNVQTLGAIARGWSAAVGIALGLGAIALAVRAWRRRRR